MLVKIAVYQDGDVWCARGIGQDIFTQGQTADELFHNIKEAVALHFENGIESPDIDILVVSELKLPHAPAATS
jgi:uridine kinase